MAKRKSNSRINGRFASIPFNVLNSHQWAALSAREVKLLMDLLWQYNGSNNGRLSPCYSLMKKRGWPKSSLHRAFNRLQHKGFVVVTRQGRKVRGNPTLVAITWMGIDEPKLGTPYNDDIQPSHTPLAYWYKSPDTWKHYPEVKRV